MKMPFGKHKDEELTEVPKGYLRWLRSQDWIAGWLANGVDQVLEGEPDPQPSTLKPWQDPTGWPWASVEDE